MKKRLILALLALLSVFSARAYDFESGDIYYNILPDATDEVEVTYKNTDYKSYSGSFAIPAKVINLGKTYRVTSIGKEAFKWSASLTRVTIPGSVTSIGNEAFCGCTGLTSVEIGDGVTSIESFAFYCCSGLTSVEIPNSVTSIGNKAFDGCRRLKSVEIPNSVTSIGYEAFYNCRSLTSVYYGGDIAQWCAIEKGGGWASGEANGGGYINYDLYINKEKVGDLVIPNSVTTIGNYAFEGCRGVTSVTIGESVTTIGSFAFYGCIGLTSVEIPNSVTSIGGGLLWNVVVWCR